MKLSLLIIAFTTLSTYAGVVVYNSSSISSSDQLNISISNPATVFFHYEDKFTKSEKSMLETWLNQTALATQQTVGNYPFDLHFFLHRSDNSKEPVPWANTERSEIQGVHFHVDTDYPIEDFLNDWTAPHEISHLAIPFVGKSNSWFAEGFATYMQNEILLEMGECTQEDVDKKFKTKLAMARPYYQKDESYVEVAKSLRKTHHYPEMYWGGAYFFIQLNNELQSEHGLTLNEVLKDYQPCCRLKDDGIEDLLNSIDNLVDGETANDLMKRFNTLPARKILLVE